MSREIGATARTDDANENIAQGYIDHCLMGGERVIYRTNLHWSIFLAPTVVTGILFVISSPNGGAAGLIGVFWLAKRIIDFLTSEFGITDRRVIMKQGWIARRSVEVALTKVEGAIVNQGLLGRILGYGTIIVRGTGGVENPFHGIARPLEFHRNLQQQMVQISQR